MIRTLLKLILILGCLGNAGPPPLLSRGHGMALSQVAWSAQGRMLVTASEDGSVVAWRTEDGTEAGRYSFANAVPTSLHLRPDSKQLAVAWSNHRVTLLKLPTLTEQVVIPDVGRQVAWHPSRPLLAGVQFSGERRSVGLWDAGGRPMPHPPMRCETAIDELIWSPDGALLAATTAGGAVCVWSTAEDFHSWRIQVPGVISDVAWCPSTERLAIAYHPGQHDRLPYYEPGKQGRATIVVWEPRAERTSELGVGCPGRLAWRPDGTQLLCFDPFTFTLTVLSPVPGRARRDLSLPGLPEVVAWNAAGTRIALALTRKPSAKEVRRGGDPAPLRSLLLLDARLKIRAERQGLREPLAWSADGEALAATRAEADQTPVWWRTGGTGAPHPLGMELSAVDALAWRSDGGALAVADLAPHLTVWEEKRRRPARLVEAKPGAPAVWAWRPHSVEMAVATPLQRDHYSIRLRTTNSRRGMEIARLDAAQELKLRWTADGSRLAVLDSVHGAVVIQPKRKQVHRIRLDRDEPPTVAAWNEDGDRLALGTAAGTVVVWSTSRGEVLQQARVPAAVSSLVWMKGGRALWAASTRTGLYTWDLHTGEAPKSVAGVAPVVRIAPSPSGDRAALELANRTVLLVRIDDESVKPLPGAAPPTAWSPSGRWLATRGEAGFIVWDAVRRKPQTTRPWTGSRLHALAWSPAGDRLAVGYANGAVTLWSMPTIQPDLRLYVTGKYTDWLALKPDGSVSGSKRGRSHLRSGGLTRNRSEARLAPASPAYEAPTIPTAAGWEPKHNSLSDHRGKPKGCRNTVLRYGLWHAEGDKRMVWVVPGYSGYGDLLDERLP